jgi:hypothetical protein
VSRAAMAILIAACTAAIAGEPPIVRTINFIDLDAPGALEIVRRERPDHFAKIRKILNELPDQPPEVAPRWMRTQFNASVLQYGLLRTSDPPKARLSFILEGIGYEAVITLRNVRPKSLPAK